MLGIRLSDPDQNANALRERFLTHLVTLRAAKDPELAGKPLHRVVIKCLMRDLTFDETEKIGRRIERLVKARNEAREDGHLKPDDLRALQPLAEGANLISIPSEHRADEIASELHTDMPWMGPANERVWHAMRSSVREGRIGFRLPPMLLDGPPGIGKSHWARKLGTLISAPVMVMDAGNENASFGLVGSQRGWSGAEPGRLVRTILRARIANPIVVVDEIEKAGTATSTRGQAYGLPEAMLPLLEPLTARRWSCPYYQVPFDMSWVGWILTSNTAALLPEPFRSRCPPITLRHLTADELSAFVRREGARRDLSETAIEAMAEVLTHPSVRDHRPSLRIAARMLQRASDLENAPLLH